MGVNVYKEQNKLEDKIKRENIKQLKEQGYSLRVVMFRDYLAKLELLDNNEAVCARFNLYYSPKRKAFTVTFEKSDNGTIKNLLSDVFEGAKGSKEPEAVSDIEYQAFVDGSHINSKTGYGAVILRHGVPIKKISGRVDSSDGLRQVTGELRAVQEVLEFCQEKDINEIAIFYDYTGIMEWAVGSWKANNTVTKAYKAFMKKNPVKIHWYKVKAHSGSMFNEMADILAKKGAKDGSGV